MSAVQFSFRILDKRNFSRLLMALFAVLIASALHAQIVETGVITGVVKDHTGAVIPSAQVSVQNTGTGLTTNTTTDSQGIYVSPPLHPGDYKVLVEAPGFSKVEEHVRLEVGQRVSADAALAVGTAAETIEVQTNSELLETESSNVGNLRTEEAVKDLPLNGRNFSELFSLGAGVVSTTTQGSSIAYTAQRGPSYFAINGSRPQENRTLVDGIGDQENHNSMAAVFPPIDAIQEFSEETQDADARYGRGNGGTINVVVKSGTDKFHGDVFEFFRNTALDARNYFNTAVPGPTGQKAALRQNEFGATFGGPVFYKQANPRTFFFADYAGKRFAQGQTDVESVPVVNITATGYDFSKYSAAIKNPLTHVAYAKNFVPISDPLIDQTGANLLNFYQKYAQPNYGAAGATVNNYFYGPLLIINEDDFDVKIDRKFTEKDSAFLRYSQGHDILSQPGTLPTPLVGDVICGPASDPAHQGVLSETHVFSPSIVNTARAGWTRFFVYAKNWDGAGSSYAGLATPSQLNIPGVINPNNLLSVGLPVYTFSGYTPIGDAGNSPTNIGTNNYQWDDDLTLVRGKHSIDLGVDLIRLEYNMFQSGAEHGSEAYATRYTGLAWSDLLFGAPTGGSFAFPSGVGLRESDLSFYVQDNYKVSSRLTLNLGVHYENFLGWPWTEAHNKEYAFVPSISTTALEQVGTNGIPKSGLSGNNLNFAPRVGLAYKVTNKTVFHAGYGIYYAAPNLGVSSTLAANVPVYDYWAFNNPATYVAGATSSASFNYASSGFVHTVATSGSQILPGQAAYAVDPNAKTPYTEQWHAAIEQQIPFSTVLKFAYVGTKGTHLDDIRDINSNPWGAVEPGSPNGATTVTVARPYPTFGQISQFETRQVSSYNALQVTAERRAHGLSFLASYTYSHALDEGSAESAGVSNPYNLRYDYGNADYDVPNRFVASSNYQLPFKGSGPLGPLERGWQLNAIGQFYDGTPFSVGSTLALGDGLSSRAILLPGYGNGSLPKGQRGLTAAHPWFNTAAFAVPASNSFTYGNSGRNSLEGPGTKYVDFSIFKDTHLTESKVLQLRAEAFNLANTPQFNNPNATAGTAAIGSISGAGSDLTFQRTARQIQLAAKITF